MQPPNNDQNFRTGQIHTPSKDNNRSIKVALGIILSAAVIGSVIVGMDPAGQALFLVGSMKITMPFVVVVAAGCICSGVLIIALVKTKKPIKPATPLLSDWPSQINSQNVPPISKQESQPVSSSGNAQFEAVMWTKLLESMQVIKPLVEQPGTEELAFAIKTICRDLESLLAPSGVLDACSDRASETQLMGKVKEFGDYLLNALGEKKRPVLNYLYHKLSTSFGPTLIYMLIKEKVLHSENITEFLPRFPNCLGILAAHFMHDDKVMLQNVVGYLSTEMCPPCLRKGNEHLLKEIETNWDLAPPDLTSREQWKFMLQDLFERLSPEMREAMLPGGFKLENGPSGKISIDWITPPLVPKIKYEEKTVIRPLPLFDPST